MLLGSPRLNCGLFLRCSVFLNNRSFELVAKCWIIFWGGKTKWIINPNSWEGVYFGSKMLKSWPASCSATIQRNVVLMKYLLKKRTNAIELVLYCRADTFGTEKPYNWPLEHSWFLGSVVHEFRLKASLARVLSVFAKQVLNKRSDRQVEEVVQDAVNGLKSTLDGINLKWRRKELNKPCGLFLGQAFNGPIFNIMKVLVEDPCPCEIGEGFADWQWSEVWRVELCTLTEKAMRG